MIISMLLISVAVIGISGIPGLVFSRRSPVGQWIAAGLNLIGSIVGGVALVLNYAHPEASHPINVDWTLPLGRFAVGVDGISLIFLIPILFISAVGSIYGLSYWKQSEHIGDGRKLRLCWGLMTAGMALVVLARDGVLFLMAWEVMALAAFFLIATEENKRDARKAAWVYLIAAHVGTLCLYGFFALLRHITGSFDLWPSAPVSLSPHMAGALFIAGAVGFCLKAGVMPLHFWLPGAHANAPSHVSAVLSGVLLKTGIYGMIRLTAFMPNPPMWWGATLLIAGAISAVLGICFAAGQRDLKRLLAYSSIENVGIIVLGLGLATVGRTLGRVDFVVLGLGGALLHTLNHSLFKPLLFLGAGSVVHAAHTRQIDRLGGLGKPMPQTFALFLIAAVAIAGLPPLNGFVGELFLYIGFFRAVVATPARWGWLALAAPVLAVAGALAVACFVKLVGAVFCGSARTARAARVHEADSTMLAPMWLLASGCVLIGLIPLLTVPLLDQAIAIWAPEMVVTSLAGYVPLGWLTATALGLVALVSAGAVGFDRLRRAWPVHAAGTWDCGYARPTARMQYGGSSFSQMIVELLAWALWPRLKQPGTLALFAGPSSFNSEVPDVVLDRALVPACGSAERILGRARILQRGPIQLYLLYVLAILILLLLFA